MIIRQCVQVARGTDAIGTTFKAGDMAIINITSKGTRTACVDITSSESGCKPFSGCDVTGSVGTISNHIYLVVGTITQNVSGARERRARGCTLRGMCSAVHEAFSREHGLASLMTR